MMTIDQLLCDYLKISMFDLQKIIYNVESIFNYYCSECEDNFNDEDKIILLYLLTYTENDIEYEFYNQKIYIYIMIIYLNFKSEESYLYIDKKYINKLINTILNSNIISNLFCITDTKLNNFKKLFNIE